MMRKMLIAIAAAAALGSAAFAEDVQVPGKKVLLKTPPSGTTNNKIVFLAKDGGVQIPSGPTQDPTVSGGYLHVSTASDDFTINLAAANWQVIGGGSIYKYKDTSGATCTLVMVKDGKLVKAICKGSQVAVTLGPAAEGDVNVILGLGAEPLRHCVQFDTDAPESCDNTKDGSNGKTYLSKNCAGATVGCPSPSGAFLDETTTF